MNFLAPLNNTLFLLLNADPATPAGRLHIALFVANRLILLAPIGLVALWLWGRPAQRAFVLNAVVNLSVALTLSYLCGALWPHPRPFVQGLGHAFFAHVASPSFPSNHTLILAILAFTLLRHSFAIIWGIATLCLATLVGLSRVYLGVHFPFDILGGLLLAPLVCALMAPFWNRYGHALTAGCQSLYSKILAWPIAWGWIRD